MAVTAVVDHESRWTFEPPVRLGPHRLHLRPADHAPGVRDWSLTTEPAGVRTTWRCRDGWWHGRLTAPGRVGHLSLRSTTTVVIDAVDPTRRPGREPAPPPPATDPRRVGGAAARLVADLDPPTAADPTAALGALVAVAGRVAGAVAHRERADDGHRPVAVVLAEGWGSCRDAAVVLVDALGAVGARSRVVTGLLVRLADQPELAGRWADAPVPTEDASGLHAWAEAWVDGLGWVGLDATSGLPAGGGHLPMATADHRAPLPVVGTTEPCRARLAVAHRVRRVPSGPAVTRSADPEGPAVTRSADAEGPAVTRSADAEGPAA